jgi:hypothetical protein
VLARECQRAAGGHPGIDVEELRRRLHGRCHTVRGARENPEADTFTIALGQERAWIVAERGLCFFVG